MVANFKPQRDVTELGPRKRYAQSALGSLPRGLSHATAPRDLGEKVTADS